MSTARRIWLRVIAAGSALPLLDAANPAAAQERATAKAGYGFFTEAEARFVAAAADRLIPEDEFPSASLAGVVDFIDGQLAGAFGKGHRMYLAGPHAQGTPEQGYQLGLAPAALYRESLQALLADPAGREFSSRSPQQQDEFLGQLESGAWMLGRVPSSVFFETLLSNVIEGYFADPAYGGNRDMAGWRMIGFPGAYAHYTQWVGRHNVRFNRPPVGIASQRTPGLHDRGTHGHGGADARVPASARPAPKKER